MSRCKICDWSPTAESDYALLNRSTACELLADIHGGDGYICSDCAESISDALSEFDEELDERSD